MQVFITIYISLRLYVCACMCVVCVPVCLLRYSSFNFHLPSGAFSRFVPVSANWWMWTMEQSAFGIEYKVSLETLVSLLNGNPSISGAALRHEGNGCAVVSVPYHKPRGRSSSPRQDRNLCWDFFRCASYPAQLWWVHRPYAVVGKMRRRGKGLATDPHLLKLRKL